MSKQSERRFIIWLKAVDLFRALQNERMILRDATADDAREHRTGLDSLIAQGERLITETFTPESSVASTLPFKLMDLEATIESLRIDEAMWHGQSLTDERRREILKTVFVS